MSFKYGIKRLGALSTNLLKLVKALSYTKLLLSITHNIIYFKYSFIYSDEFYTINSTYLLKVQHDMALTKILEFYFKALYLLAFLLKMELL
jgi:hypothetical protein